MNGDTETGLTAEDRALLRALGELPDERIRITPDAPEIEDDAVGIRGLMRRRPKQSVTIRLDGDIVDWFRSRSDGRGYQTRMNEALRRQMELEKSGRR